MELNLIKKTIVVIILFAILGFIIYKITWQNNNIVTNSMIPIDSLNQLSDNDDKQTYDKFINEIQEQISQHSELEVLNSYKSTENLRNLLLENKLKATDIINSKHLLPPNIVIPKTKLSHLTEIKPNVNINNMHQVANINHPTMITDMPNYF